MNILLGVSGSVAATLLKKMVTTFEGNGHEVRIIATERGRYFSCDQPGEHPYANNKFFHDADEWPFSHYYKNDRVLHIELTDWADVFVIAPLTANTAAKMANGIADNLLTSCVLAWDLNKPMVVAPAMNTRMLNNPVVAHNFRMVTRYYQAHVMPTQVKKLACSTDGDGALCDISEIVKHLEFLKECVVPKK